MVRRTLPAIAMFVLAAAGSGAMAEKAEIESVNLVENGEFPINLASWSAGDGSAAWSPESARADGTGSVRLTCDAASAGTACSPLLQCIPVSPGRYLLELAVRVPPGQSRTGHGYAIGYAYGNIGCGGAPISGSFSTAPISSAAWNRRWVVVDVPAGGASFSVRLTLVKLEAGGSFDVLEDAVGLFTGLVFADGFESGSPSQWSLTSP